MPGDDIAVRGWFSEFISGGKKGASAVTATALTNVAFV